jgi:hypothetical protein
MYIVFVICTLHTIRKSAAGCVTVPGAIIAISGTGCQNNIIPTMTLTFVGDLDLETNREATKVLPDTKKHMIGRLNCVIVISMSEEKGIYKNSCFFVSRCHGNG